MPEMFYSQNRLTIYNQAEDVFVTFSPFDSMAVCVEKLRERCLQKGPEKVDKVWQIDHIPD